MPITNNDWRPISSHPEFQQKLIDDKIFSTKSTVYIFPKNKTVDINTEEDWDKAKLLFKKK